MTRKRKRAQHTFAGQQEAMHLAEWLNGEESSRIGADRDERRKELRGEARIRVRIAQLVQDLNTNAETFIREGKSDAKLTEQIDRELSRYALKVSAWQVHHDSKYKTFSEPRWIFRWDSNAGERAAQMIFTIARLGERGLLARVRMCARCSRWFYAKFNHQRFCGKKCQLLHYQTSEEWKARRRERYREQKF